MIHSVFIITAGGDIIVEKHYRAPITRTVLDPFLEEQVKAEAPEQVPSVIPSSRHYVVSVYRNNLFFVGIINADVQPLFVMEFLHRIVDTFADYFGGVCSEKKITQETVIVHQVLEEMLDNGFPLTVELNILKEMVQPPSWKNLVTGKKRVKDTLPSGQLSATQWRRSGAKYAANEMFIDIVESIDAIVDRHGAMIQCEVNGKIECRCRLSGTPDLVLSFSNPRIIDDISFHPCVRISQWSNERVMSFIPPDGNFTLCSYGGAPSQIGVPVYCKPSFTFDHGTGKFEVELGPKQSVGRPVDDVVVSFPFTKAVNNVKMTFTSHGVWNYDQIKRVLRWELKKLPTDKPAVIRGTISFAAGETAVAESPTLALSFKVTGYAASGLKVNRLDIYNEKYKPFKGVKYITSAGDFQIRT